MEIKGVDISYCQAGIDYNKLKADGVKFAIIRAGFSETEDKLLKTHIDGLRKVGIPFGLYWYSYAYNMTETQKEADACVAVIKKYQLQNELSYPVFYDIEEQKHLKVGKMALTNMADEFKVRLNRAGIFTGLYVNPNFMECAFDKERIMRNHDIWLAHWTENPEQKSRYNYGQKMWQWGIGKVGNMDVDGDLCFIDYPVRINEWRRECGIGSAGSQPAQKTVNFTPRLTAPSTTDKYWRHTSKGGLNECIHISGGSCLPNCVGYAWGRFYEIIGERPALSRCNAEMWYGNTADGYKRSSTPALGAIACWSKGAVGNEADGAGHVAIVERIEANGDIVTSNSAYGGSRFYTQTYKKSAGYSFGAYKFQGFILPPVQIKDTTPAATSKPAAPTAFKVGDVVEFKGRTHYTSSTGTRGTAAKPGRAKVTIVAAGAAHPYHLIAESGSGSTVYGWVNAADIGSVKSTAAQIKVGSTVMLRKGAKDYNGGRLASFVYTRPHIVGELKGDRAVITFGGVVVAAVKTSDLTLA